MTLQQYLDTQSEFDKDYGVLEPIVIDSGRSELLSWSDNDPKYQAKVLGIIYGYADDSHNISQLKVMIDWNGMAYGNPETIRRKGKIYYDTCRTV